MNDISTHNDEIFAVQFSSQIESSSGMGSWESLKEALELGFEWERGEVEPVVEAGGG